MELEKREVNLNIHDDVNDNPQFQIPKTDQEYLNILKT
jgi:hypothetical protein